MVRLTIRGAAISLGIYLLAMTAAHAQANIGTVDQIIQQFQSQSNGWGASLKNLALASFGTLALIDLTWSVISWAMRGSTIGDLLESLITEIMFLGIFLALLQNSVAWSGDIVNSFRQAASAAGANAVTPGAVVAAGVNIAQQVMAVAGLAHPFMFVGLIIAAIVICICFAGIALLMAAVLVESYLIIQAGVILMAFGGSRWTKDIALATIKYAVAVGAKLMILQFLASIGTNFVTQWTQGFNANNNTPLLIVISCSIVLLGISKIVPDTFQRLVGGASLASGTALAASAGMVGAGVAAVGLGAAGAGAAAMNAGRLAGSQMAARDEAIASATGAQPQQSRAARAAMMTGFTARNLAKAVGSDIGGRLSGQVGGGRASWRMSSGLNRQNSQIRNQNNRT